MRWKFRPALYRSFEAALSAFIYLQFTNFKQSVSLFFLFNFNFLDMKWNLICSTRFLMQVQFDIVYDREKGRSKTNKGGCNAYIWSSQPTLGNRLLLLHHCIAMLRPGAEFELNCLGLDSIGKGSFGHYPNYLFPLPPYWSKMQLVKKAQEIRVAPHLLQTMPKRKQAKLDIDHIVQALCSGRRWSSAPPRGGTHGSVEHLLSGKFLAM